MSRRVRHDGTGLCWPEPHSAEESPGKRAINDADTASTRDIAILEPAAGQPRRPEHAEMGRRDRVHQHHPILSRRATTSRLDCPEIAAAMEGD